MSDTQSELRQRFYGIAGQARGPARTAGLEALVDAVDAVGEQPLLNEVLSELANSFRWGEDSQPFLTAFGRLLRNLDTEPEWFDEPVLRHTYWALHTMATKMLERPDVPLASMEEFAVEMRRRYSLVGRSAHPAHQFERSLASHIGDAERAATALAAMEATEPNLVDDCDACISFETGRAYAEIGELERALELWAPVIAGEVTCPIQPQEVLAASLAPLVELGRLDEARAHHLRGYQLVRGADDMIPPFAGHVRFCVLSGNEARAVEMLTGHAHLFDLDLAPMFRRSLLEAVQLTCASLRARGLGDVELPGPDGRPVNADDLHDLVDAERREICERFDHRNGTDTQSRRSAELVAYTDDSPHVPLGLKASTRTAPAVRAAPEPAAPQDLERLLADARAADAAFADDRFERWGRIGDLAEASGIELDTADAAEVLVSRFNDQADPALKLAMLRESASLFRKIGDEARAVSLESAALRLRADDEPDQVRAEAPGLIAAAERLADASPLHSLRARTAAYTALVEVARNRREAIDPALRDAIAALDAEMATSTGERGVSESRARLNLVIASIAETEEERTAAIRTAHERAVAGEHAQETVVAAIWLISVLNAEGRPDDALQIAEDAIAVVRPEFPDVTVAALHRSALDTAARLGRWSRTEHHAVTAAHHYDRCGESGLAAGSRHMAGLAMSRQGRHEAAVLMLEAALGDLAEAGDDEQWRTVDAHALLSEAHHELGDPETGAKHALESLRLMDGGVEHPNPARYAQTAHLAGVQLDRTEEPEAALIAFGRAEQAWRALGTLPAAARSARAALWTGQELDHDRETGSNTFAALAAELRSDWHDEEFAPAYRDACRRELGETLGQHAEYLGFEPAAIPLLREALTVLAGDEPDDRAVQFTHRLMHQLTDEGDLPGAEAVAEQALARLGPGQHREGIEARLARARKA